MVKTKRHVGCVRRLERTGLDFTGGRNTWQTKLLVEMLSGTSRVDLSYTSNRRIVRMLSKKSFSDSNKTQERQDDVC